MTGLEWFAVGGYVWVAIEQVIASNKKLESNSTWQAIKNIGKIIFRK